MKRFLMLYFLTMLVVLSLSAQEVEWLWAQKAKVSSIGKGQSVAVDKAGNIYVTGFFTGTIYFDTLTETIKFTSDTYNDIFIAKMDAKGNWLWAKQVGGTSDDLAHGIAVDTDGNCYVTGSFKYTAEFGSTTLTNNGFADIFITKLDTNGNWIWAKQAGGRANDYSYDIAVDTNGNCYVTGEFRDVATFGSMTIKSSSAHADIFVAKADSTGTWLWAEQAGGTYQSDTGKGIAVDSEGNSYVTGNIFNTATFGTTTLNGRGEDIFIAKMSPNGKWIWANLAGWVADDFAQSIAVDSVGNTFVTGHFEGTAKFGDITLTSNGSYDAYVAKADKNGKWLWADSVSGATYKQGNGVAVDDKGNCYVTGYFSDTATFGDLTLTSAGSSDVFIAKVDTNGNWLWAKQAEGPDQDRSWSIFVDEYYNCYVTGNFFRTITFDNTTLTAEGNSNIFVAKLNTPIRTVLFPNGGEELIGGETQTVRWLFNVKSMVNVKLSTDGGHSWDDLTQSPIDSDLEEFTFTVPFVNSDNCLIKVESVDDSNKYAISDEPFSIVTQLVAPTANFEANVTSGSLPLPVHFNDLSDPGTDIIISWLWEFGDGQTSDEQNPMHLYEEEGLYTVKLTVTNTVDLSDSITKVDYIEAYSVGVDEKHHLPLRTELNCNYPNPFNPETQLQFSLAEPGVVKIDVYNLQGQLIKTLTNAYYPSGRYTVVWDGSDSDNKQVGSGIYFYRMKTKDYIETRRMSLIK